jgi:hypothetical protein
VSSMSRDLAREIGRERIAGADRERLAREARRARREQRRARRQASTSWWRPRRVPLVGGKPSLTAAPALRPEDVLEELGILLGGIAERIADRGTESERVALHAVHDAARWSAPGAAAALVDWEGSETARLRAFGVLHGVVLSVLGDEDRAWLLDRLRGGGADEQGQRVA